MADVGRSSVPEESRTSAVSAQSTDDLLTAGSLVAGLLVVDAFVGVSVGWSLGCSPGASVGVSHVVPLVAGSLEVLFVGRAISIGLSTSDFVFFTSLLVLSLPPCIFL